MDKDVKSVLSFVDYNVEEVVFKNNRNFEDTGKPINIDFNINHQTHIEGNKMNIQLEVKVFENMDKNNYPFSIKCNIQGEFIIQGEDIKKFEINAIAILYPYARAIISTYTANSNIPTLILPPINVNKVIKEQNKL